MPQTLHLVRKPGLLSKEVLRSVGTKSGSPLPQGQSKVRVSCSTQGVFADGVEHASPASIAFLHLRRGYRAHGTPHANARVVVVVVVVVLVVVVVVVVVVVLVVVVVVLVVEVVVLVVDVDVLVEVVEVVLVFVVVYVVEEVDVVVEFGSMMTVEQEQTTVSFEKFQS